MDLNQSQKLEQIARQLKSLHAKANADSVQFGTLSNTSLDDFARNLAEAAHSGTKIALEQQLLGSLYFKNMKVRRSRIAEAHEKTFNWIFVNQAHCDSHSSAAIRFLDWLRSENGIYWISGKAGSGKSTLMKYLSHHPRSNEALQVWAGDAKLVTADYYFWRAGTFLQQSQQGLLQSLLYEILKECPELIPVVCPSRWERVEADSGHGSPWQLEELEEAMQRLGSQSKISAKFCFFVDGLDEYKGDDDEAKGIIKILDELTQSPQIKICVSSRPWNIFEDSYGRNSDWKIYLQDLTREDIKKYVQSQFEAHPAWKSLTTRDKYYQNIVVEITNKAQGVFLWVVLVVRSLCKGLTNGDTISLLKVRLEQLPADLEEFFRYMLGSVDVVYYRHMAQSFKVALSAVEPLPLLAYSFLDDELEDPDYALNLRSGQIDNHEINSRLDQTRRQLNGRCQGLLEVVMDRSLDDLYRYRVDFLHRTVHDFLQSEDMKELLWKFLPESFDVNLVMLKVSLALLKTWPQSEEDLAKPGQLQDLLDDAIHFACQIEMTTGTTESELLDELKNTMEEYSDQFQCRICWHSESQNFNVPYVQNSRSCDSFMEFAIQRGLHIYVKRSLNLEASRAILEQGAVLGCPLLACALYIPSSRSYGEPDVVDMVRLCLENGADPNEPYEGSTVWGYFLERITSREGYFEDGSANPDAISHRYRLIELLLLYGADPNVENDGVLPWLNLVRAAFLQKGSRKVYDLYLKIFEALLSHGADPNRLPPKRDSTTGTVWENFLFLLYQCNKKSLSSAQLDFYTHMTESFIFYGGSKKAILLTGALPKTIIKQTFPPQIADWLLRLLDGPEFASSRKQSTKLSTKLSKLHSPSTSRRSLNGFLWYFFLLALLYIIGYQTLGYIS